MNESCRNYERILREFFSKYLKKNSFFFFLLFFSHFLSTLFSFFIIIIFFLEDFVRKFSVEILPTRTHDRWNQSPELNRWATAIWNYINYVWRKDIFKLLISFAIIFNYCFNTYNALFQWGCFRRVQGVQGDQINSSINPAWFFQGNLIFLLFFF